MATVSMTADGDFPGIHPRDVMTVLLHDQTEKPFFSYWLILRMQNNVQPGTADVTIEGVSFEEPVLVDLMSGRRYLVHDFSSSDGSTTFRNLPVADYPFIITER